MVHRSTIYNFKSAIANIKYGDSTVSSPFPKKFDLDEKPHHFNWKTTLRDQESQGNTNMLRSVNDWQGSQLSWGSMVLPEPLYSIIVMEDVEPCKEMTALLSRSSCCGHFKISGIVCLALRCAGEELSSQAEEQEMVWYGRGK